MQEPKKGPARDEQDTHLPNRFANRDDETEMIERDPAERAPGGPVGTLYPDQKEMELLEGLTEEMDRQKQKEKETGGGGAAPADSYAPPTGEPGKENAEEERVRPGDRKRGREGHP